MSSVIRMAVTEEIDAQETKITPFPAKGPVGMNLLRAVHDNGEGQIQLLDADIQKMEAKLDDIRRDRMFTQLLLDICNEYHAGAAVPSGNYSVLCVVGDVSE